MKIELFNDLKLKPPLPLDPQCLHVWIANTPSPPQDVALHLLSHYLKEPLEKDQWLTGAHGKPYLQSHPLHFNISHSEYWFAMAVSLTTPVGIDIEKIRPLEGMEDMILNYFSKSERDYVHPSKEVVRFLQVWSRKEACLKALGLGLQDNLKEWDLLGNKKITEWESFDTHRVCIQSLPSNPIYSAAIAYLTELTE